MKITVLQKHVLRNILWVQIAIIFFILGLFSGVAWSAEPEVPIKVAPSVSVTTTTSTTTTTTVAPTTTTAVVPQVEKVEVEQPAVPQIVTPSGDWVQQCHAWASMAGISLPPSAIVLIERESSCNPSVMNHGGSGAGGIPQALPYTKMGCPMTYTDEAATCQLRWMLEYVTLRYGSWDSALAHSNSVGWY